MKNLLGLYLYFNEWHVGLNNDLQFATLNEQMIK